MNHPTDDELIDQFSGDADQASRARIEAHLRDCVECRRAWADLSGALTLVDNAVPEPADGFERVMWARVSQAIARDGRPAGLWSWRQLAPAGLLAAAVVAMVLAGRTPEGTNPAAATQRQDGSASARDLRQDERVLFTALDEHFQQAEALLVEVRNAPDRDTLSVERVAADDLVSAGRLYRQSAELSGHARFARMLDDLEPVLVEVARSSARIDREDRQWLRMRIDDDNLLFKVRAITTDLRERSEKGDQK
jgi:hypothetical protein